MLIAEEQFAPEPVEGRVIQPVLPCSRGAIDHLVDRPKREMFEYVAPIDERVVLVRSSANHVEPLKQLQTEDPVLIWKFSVPSSQRGRAHESTKPSWLLARRSPLHPSCIGSAVHPDGTLAPSLRGNPL